jgi:hypothetical protein
MKFCPTCKETKAATEFHKNKNTSNGLAWQCKDCRHSYCGRTKRIAKRSDGLKFCHGCEQPKSPSDFYHKKNGTIYARCKSCTAEKAKNYRLKSPDKFKSWNLKVKLKILYGLSLEEFEEMKKRQNNSCKICKIPGVLVVDHCHKTKIVRGLLCSPCNRGLGFFRENYRTLLEASEYLNHHSCSE